MYDVFRKTSIAGIVTVYNLFYYIWLMGDGIDWDNKVSTEMIARSTQLLDELTKINEYTIPRCYGFAIYRSKDVEQHGFCYYCENAFSVVVYQRFENKGKFNVSILSAKTRVAPMKPITTSRLELQAADILSRVVNTIKNCSKSILFDLIYWGIQKLSCIGYDLKQEDTKRLYL